MRKPAYWTVQRYGKFNGVFVLWGNERIATRHKTKKTADADAKELSEVYDGVEVVPVYREPIAWIVKSKLLRDQYWGGGFTFVAQQKRAALFATKASAKRATKYHGGKVVAIVRKETA